jgi:hypothetical protein
MEKEVKMIASDEFIKRMFTPAAFDSEARAERLKDEKQYIYEFVDSEFDKPLFARYIPYLYSHLSKQPNVIGVYINLNKDLIPAIQVRYAAPMTEEKLWELMTMETWTITYKQDEVKEEAAKIKFSKPGVNYEYTE